jgi:hypothetical protein
LGDNFGDAEMLNCVENAETSLKIGFLNDNVRHTAISIKVVHEQSGKVEYERERLMGIANKLMNFQSDSQRPFTLVFDFSALLVDNLN